MSLDDLILKLQQDGPVLIMDRHSEDTLKRMGKHGKVVTKGDMVGVLMGRPHLQELALARVILGAELYNEESPLLNDGVGIWCGVRRVA